MSLFDTGDFFNQRSSGGLDTKFPKVDAGDYPAIIKKFAGRSYPKKDDPSQEVHLVDVTFSVEDERQKEVTGLKEPTVRMTLFLDIVDGKLDTSKGKNVQLGRLLEAVGLNQGDWSWNDLVGRPCMIHVDHTPDERPGQQGEFFANATKVGKLG